MDFPCADNSCMVFTVLLLIMAASWVYDQPHTPQLTAISGGGQLYNEAIIHRRQYRRKNILSSLQGKPVLVNHLVIPLTPHTIEPEALQFIWSSGSGDPEQSDGSLQGKRV